MSTDVRGPKLQPRNYTPSLSVGNIRIRTYVSWSSVALYVVCGWSLAAFVTGSLTTPVRDEAFAFLVFVFSGLAIAARIRKRRRGWRQVRVLVVDERFRCER